jgi:hypothetical protein
MCTIPNKPDIFEQLTISKTDSGYIQGFGWETITRKMGMKSPGVEEVFKKQQQDSSRLNNVVVKGFPTGTLTVRELDAYLDMLHRTQNFIPDILIVDYADLMKTDVNNLRQSLGRLYIDLRGIATKRNLALVTFSQSNRLGKDEDMVDVTHVAEDWSKIGTADLILTYTQTKAEKEHNLARIYVAASRNDMDGFTIAITQNYNLGLFVIDSALMIGSVSDLIKKIEK